MRLRLSPQFPQMLQQVVVIGVVMTMVIGGTTIRMIAFTTRAMFVIVIVSAFAAIWSRRLRDARLLLSPMDLGWVSLILFAGLTVLLAPYPRRSVEPWLLPLGVQLPIAYASIYLFRRGWPERSIYRGLLVAGGYVYLMAALISLAYVLEWLNSSGGAVQPFRLWAVLDNPSVLAMFVAVSTPCIIGHVLMKTGRIERFFCLLWLLGALIAVIASGTRSGAIAAVIGSATALGLGLLAHPTRPAHRIRYWAASQPKLALGMALTGSAVLIAVFAGVLYVLSKAPHHAAPSERIDLYRIATNSFLSKPLGGEGPGGFVLAQERVRSIPPFQLVPHAHNLLLNVAAENGGLGLAGLFIFLTKAAQLCIVAWKTEPERRPLLAGAMGGLVGFLASGLFESPMSQPGLFFIASALLMLIAAGRPAPHKAPAWRLALIIIPMAIITTLSIVLLIPYNRYWTAVYTGVSAIGDDPTALRSAAHDLDGIADLDPSDPLYNLQAAYVWARLATSPGNADPTDLHRAVTHLEHAIQQDPYFGLHYLNLSVLYRKGGQQADSLQAARRAAELSYGDPAVWLNLGLQLESSAVPQNAQAAYIQAMKLEPEWSKSSFWQVSTVRQVALAQFSQTDKASRLRFEELVAAGDSARVAGQLAEAAQFYQQALEATEEPARVALAQGLLAVSRGDLPSAQRWLNDAALLGGNTFIAADTWAYLGDLAGERGARDEMLNAYGRLYQLVTSRGVEGLGSANSVAYAITSFWRIGLISDYLPDVVLLDVTPQYARRLKTLAQAIADDGDHAGAARIYRVILKANPADSEVLSALKETSP